MSEYIREEFEPHFKPTYLYIKQHKITGLKYFGKTIKDPLKYCGSGTKWKYHINYYGREHVETVWFQKFEDIDECRNYALKFSDDNDIVKSDEWANLIIENGLWITPETRKKQGDALRGRVGTRLGSKPSVETKEKIRQSKLGQKHSEESKEKISTGNKGKIVSEESKEKIRTSMIGVTHEQERIEKMRATKLENPSYHRRGTVHTDEAKEKNRLAHLGKKKGPYKTSECPHCGKVGAGGAMKRYHFDNCKIKVYSCLVL